MLEDKHISCLVDLIRSFDTPLLSLFQKLKDTFDEEQYSMVGFVLSHLIENNYLTTPERLAVFYLLYKLFDNDSTQVNPYLYIYIHELQDSPSNIEVNFLSHLFNNVDQLSTITINGYLTKTDRVETIEKFDISELKKKFDRLNPLPNFLQSAGVPSSFDLYLMSFPYHFTTNHPHEMYSPSFLLSAFHSLGSHTLLSPPLMTISPLMFPTDKNEVSFVTPFLSSTQYEVIPTKKSINSNPLRDAFPLLLLALQDSLTKGVNVQALTFPFYEVFELFLLEVYHVNPSPNEFEEEQNLQDPFSPSNIHSLIQYNSAIAIYYLKFLFQHNILKNEYLQCISTLPISKYLIDIVYNLSIQIKLPSSFLKDFFSNCIKFVYTIENKREQDNFAILISLVIQSLIRKNIYDFNAIKDEIMIFCLSFSALKQVSVLFSVINTTNHKPQ